MPCEHVFEEEHAGESVCVKCGLVGDPLFDSIEAISDEVSEKMELMMEMESLLTHKN
jgi:transcription initiation factor TFIIIB Brf1 subunit/transcription initiation factor TFIIB